MKILALIPARMGSTRFPGKPMAEILGKPMIGHVYERVAQASILTHVAVATCDKVIFDYIISIGGSAVMTSNTHERASDRCAEALLSLELKQNLRYDYVVMVQGDEPLIVPPMLSEALDPIISDPTIDVVNLVSPINSTTELHDPNCIKVVCDLYGNALYFSREPIPSRYVSENVPMLKQVCIIPFRRDFLVEFIKLSQTPLEVAESVDMMRALEHGRSVRMVPTKYRTHAVDVPGDLTLVETMMLVSQ